MKVPLGERSVTFQARHGLPRSHPCEWHVYGHRPSRPCPPRYQNIVTLVRSEWQLSLARHREEIDRPLVHNGAPI